MPNRHARELHKHMDAAFLEALHRDGSEEEETQNWASIARPIRFRRSDLVMSDATLLKAAKLWEKTSERNGRRYLTGRLGGLRVLVFENHDKKNADDPTHFLLFGEASDKPRQGEKARA